MQFLKDYLSPLLKWWWLVVTAPMIAAVSAYFFAQQLPPVYQARTTLLIGRAIQDPNPSSNEFSLSYQLASEYANMAMREPVQNAVKEKLGLTKLPEYEATPRGIFLEIAVIHTDPKFAQVVANVIADTLINLSPVNSTPTTGEDPLFVQNQLAELQTGIENTRDEIKTKQALLSNQESALDIAKIQAEITALETKLSTLQEIFANLYSSTSDAAFNTLSVFDLATEPKSPIGPQKVLIVLLAALSGLVFAVAAAYLIEFLDDTIKNTDEISRLINVPVMGMIAEMPGFKPTFAADQPRSPIADAFRSLRTNLEFSAVDRSMKKLIISSAEASDGKSTIAMNLAIVMAQSEKKVILMDADLRSPSIHRYLGIPENPGLSDIFLDRVKIQDALVEWSGPPKFWIIPAGATPPNSAELLGSRKMDQILEELAGMADIIVVDGPPGFVVDSMVLASKVDAVLLVVNIGETRRGPIKAVTDQFQRIGANLVGVVLNRVTRGSTYYGSYYYSSYYSREPATRPIKSSPSRRWKLKLKQLRLSFVGIFQKKKLGRPPQTSPLRDTLQSLVARIKLAWDKTNVRSKVFAKDGKKKIENVVVTIPLPSDPSLKKTIRVGDKKDPLSVGVTDKGMIKDKVDATKLVAEETLNVGLEVQAPPKMEELTQEGGTKAQVEAQEAPKPKRKRTKSKTIPATTKDFPG
jgi:succinoglycan biosynthesis transport protein ExoP